MTAARTRVADDDRARDGHRKVSGQARVVLGFGCDARPNSDGPRTDATQFGHETSVNLTSDVVSRYSIIDGG